MAKRPIFPPNIFFPKNEVLPAQVLLIGSCTRNIDYRGTYYIPFEAEFIGTCYYNTFKSVRRTAGRYCPKTGHLSRKIVKNRSFFDGFMNN